MDKNRYYIKYPVPGGVLHSIYDSLTGGSIGSFYRVNSRSSAAFGHWRYDVSGLGIWDIELTKELAFHKLKVALVNTGKYGSEILDLEY